MKDRFRILVIVTLFALQAITAWGAGIRMSVDTRGGRGIQVGDLFYIYIEVTDMEAAPEKPTAVPGAKVIYFDRTGQSSMFSSSGGKTTQTFSYTWTVTLRAQKEGTFHYGPITLGKVKSNEISYSIGAQSASEAGQRQDQSSRQNQASRSDASDDDKPKYIGKGDGNLFLKANVSKTSVYEQEALVYTVKLYTTYDAIKFIGATATPKFEGFVVEESKDVSSSLSYENYNGKTYATAVIARYIIFPQLTGNLKVLGNTYTVSVNDREYYHDPFWGNMSYSKPLQLNVSPNDLSVNVKALPSPKPADFSGGVGKFSITSSLPSANLKTNQAASVVYTVSGEGNIKYVTLPDLNVIYPDELEVYSPKTDIKTSVGGSNVSGSVKFDYSFMPLEEGEFDIPAIKLVYFDPSTGKYETSTAKGYKITVGKGASSAKSQSKGNLRFDSELMPVEKNELQKKYVPIIDKFSYWLWFIIPLLILVSGVVYRRIYERSHSDMDAYNSKRADKIARKRLRKAAECMRKNDKDHFYDEILIALWGYLGDKLKMPTSELMRDNIKAVLIERDIDSEVISSLLQLLDECEFAKYSSAKAENEMSDVYSSTIEIINRLEKSFKTKKSNEK